MYKTIDLFAGIGGIRLGFQAHGCHNVFSSEWDKDAQKMYEANFGEQFRRVGNAFLPTTLSAYDGGQTIKLFAHPTKKPPKTVARRNTLRYFALLSNHPQP